MIVRKLAVIDVDYDQFEEIVEKNSDIYQRDIDHNNEYLVFLDDAPLGRFEPFLSNKQIKEIKDNKIDAILFTTI